MALHSQVQLCYVEMEVEHRQSCAGEREEGECMAPSQQSHLCQVGWGYKPRGEGGSEGEGPRMPLLSQGAQGQQQGECAEAAGSRERECVAGAWASESLMGDLQETPSDGEGAFTFLFCRAF